jgi:hypothetical protein
MKRNSEQGEVTSDDLARIRSFIEKHNRIFAERQAPRGAAFAA